MIVFAELSPAALCDHAAPALLGTVEMQAAC